MGGLTPGLSPPSLGGGGGGVSLPGRGDDSFNHLLYCPVVVNHTYQLCSSSVRKD